MGFPLAFLKRRHTQIRVNEERDRQMRVMSVHTRRMMTGVNQPMKLDLILKACRRIL